MKKFICMVFIVIAGATPVLNPAVYKGESIDERHFDAKIWLKENTLTQYRVDVVFVGKAANMVFAIDQVLPATLRSDRYLTLYLKDEIISNPDRIELRQLNPPALINEENENPDSWEVAAVWIMKLAVE